MWDLETTAKLKKLFNWWLSNLEIAIKLNKTEDSVRNKLKRLGLTRPPIEAKPKILFLDIETAPIEAYTWGLFDQNIGINQIKSDWYMLCWSAKWLDWDFVLSDQLSTKESIKKNDKRISKSVLELMNSADIIVGHNIDAFDVKKINARLIYNGCPLPTHYQTIDTLKLARKIFGITSNKLDYLCRFMWVGQKVSTWGFELWERCVKWEQEALDLMREYCQNDVVILEKLYKKIIPYAKAQYELVEKRFLKSLTKRG